METAVPVSFFEKSSQHLSLSYLGLNCRAMGPRWIVSSGKQNRIIISRLVQTDENHSEWTVNTLRFVHPSNAYPGNPRSKMHASYCSLRPITKNPLLWEAGVIGIPRTDLNPSDALDVPPPQPRGGGLKGWDGRWPCIKHQVNGIICEWSCDVRFAKEIENAAFAKADINEDLKRRTIRGQGNLLRARWRRGPFALRP